MLNIEKINAGFLKDQNIAKILKINSGLYVFSGM